MGTFNAALAYRPVYILPGYSAQILTSRNRAADNVAIFYCAIVDPSNKTEYLRLGITITVGHNNILYHGTAVNCAKQTVIISSYYMIVPVKYPAESVIDASGGFQSSFYIAVQSIIPARIGGSAARR